MQDFIINWGFSTVITLLQGLVTDPAKKRVYERVMLKVFSLIWSVFSSDKRFRTVVGLPSIEE